MMPIDPAAQAILTALEAAGGPPLNEMEVGEAREAYANLATLTGEGADIASVAEREIAGVRSVVVTPHGDGPFPVFVWVHGGGWVIGSATESGSSARDLAAGGNCVVVSVDYRPAPEHKAPAAGDDTLALVRRVLGPAAEIGGGSGLAAGGGAPPRRDPPPPG